MSSNFEWVTDEERDWPELTPQPPPKPHRPRPWRWLLLLVLVMVLGGSGIARQMQQRIDSTTEVVTQDVQNTYQLYARAVQNQDAELLKTLIAGSSPVWWRTQLALLSDGLLQDRWPLGLHTTEGTPPEIIAITPSPDFTEAEVVTHQAFTFIHADSRTETATLENSTFLRRGADRWLVVPPDANYWGSWQVKNGDHLSIIFPERDKEQAEHLLLGLEAELARACRRLDLPCPAAGSYTIRLDTDPASLLQITDPVAMLTRQPILNLPAPSLVGRPLDITGERALLRAYAAHFITAVLVYNSGWRCCEQGLFHQALIDYQLAQLDLRPWPLQDSHYQAMMRDPLFGVAGLGRFWHEPPVRPISGYAQPQIYAMVDVLLHEKPALHAYDLQQRLTVIDNYQNWIAGETGFGFMDSGLFQRAWVDNLQAHLRPSPEEIPQPEQDVLLLCRNTTSAGQYGLYRYSWTQDAWSSELPDRRFDFMAGMPGDSGVMLQEQLGREFLAGLPEDMSVMLQEQLERERLIHTFRWIGGREETLAIYPAQSTIFRVEPVGNNVLFYVFKFDENSAEFNLLDLDSCYDYGCEPGGYTHPPVWSPDGRWLVETNDAEELWLRESTDDRVLQVRHGRAPFWLNNIFYGFVAADELIITSLSETQAPRQYSLEPLEAAIASAHPKADWMIHTIVPEPGTNALFVAVEYTEPLDDDTISGTLLLYYDLSADEAELLFEGTEQFGLYSTLTFSPDGRWLNVQSFSNHDFDWQLDILNLETGQHVSYRSSQSIALPGFDWSADGRWLLRLEDDFIHLSDPETGTEQLLTYDEFASCGFAAWVQ